MEEADANDVNAIWDLFPLMNQSQIAINFIQSMPETHLFLSLLPSRCLFEVGFHLGTGTEFSRLFLKISKNVKAGEH
jgi:hypothetical protein